MRTVGAFEAKTHFAQLLDEVQRTRSEIIIQRRGKTVAKLVPVENPDEAHVKNMEYVIAEIKALRERIRARGPLPPVTATELVNEGRKR